MYIHIWNKYIPVIRILLKRAVNEEQSLQLNSSDFEKTGPQKKVGFNFTLKFHKGRVDNLAGLSNPAKELSGVLLQDPVINQLFSKGEYILTMNSKYVLGITLTPEHRDEAEPALTLQNAE